MRALVLLTIAACAESGPPPADKVIARLGTVGASCERGRWGQVECGSQDRYAMVLATLQLRPGDKLEHLLLKVGGVAGQQAWPRIDAVIDGLVSDKARAAIYAHLEDQTGDDNYVGTSIPFDDYQVAASRQAQGMWSVYRVSVWWPK